MIEIRPFKGFRPKEGLEGKIACKPYDVITYDEALEEGRDNPLSFLHIIRSEIDLPLDTDPYSQQVYDKAKENLEEFLSKGYLIEEEKRNFYIYRQIMDGRIQDGLVACASIDDYARGTIKRHELTRVDKEEDRVNHFYTVGGNTEPVFLFHKKNGDIKAFIKDWIENHQPVYDFNSQDGVRQVLWIVDDEGAQAELVKLFKSLDSLYIADGHHRTASAYKVGLKKREENPKYTGGEEFNYFLSVIFSEDELYIMPYNRLVKDLNGYRQEEFLERVKEKFVVEALKELEEPKKKGQFTLAFKDKAYKLIPRDGTYKQDDPIESLDPSILQNNILGPILGIEDPRTSHRIDFVGGVGMLDKIKAGLEEDKVAFLLYPTDIGDIIRVSDEGKIMPPKSTWFEPKLMSGLFIHKF